MPHLDHFGWSNKLRLACLRLAIWNWSPQFSCTSTLKLGQRLRLTQNWLLVCSNNKLLPVGHSKLSHVSEDPVPCNKTAVILYFSLSHSLTLSAFSKVLHLLRCVHALQSGPTRRGTRSNPYHARHTVRRRSSGFAAAAIKSQAIMCNLTFILPFRIASCQHGHTHSQ